jgi:hypothetical protein
MARWFEQLTANDRQETLKQIAVAESVVYAMLGAMGHLAGDTEDQ